MNNHISLQLTGLCAVLEFTTLQWSAKTTEVGDEYDQWDFIDNGLSSSSDSDFNVTAVTQRFRSGRLGEGKLHQEALKQRLFHAKQRQEGL
jgi:hypothetical protein